MVPTMVGGLITHIEPAEIMATFVMSIVLFEMEYVY